MTDAWTMAEGGTDEAERKPSFWTVAVYLCDRAYGGGEEGGWWYDTGERIDDPREYGAATDPQYWTPAIFHTEAEAWSYAKDINKWLDDNTNADGLNRDLSSVNCEGRYCAEVHEGYPPAGYPDHKPHYE